MSYQVLARKWRPRTFPEMVGQEHVLRALINALDSDRLHHAYLFTGTRGVGKTTVARILAKSLNCEQGVGAHPCGECGACREIDEGRFVDLIEVDAASRTKVEDTRELLDNVQYAPSRGRYKVYLVDEVHMLSAHSFNALLKTLEEPPPHVKFLLATTDPQRLPVTILSRCLQFNLKRLPAEAIREYLAKILEQEGIETEPAALVELARAADGSMRDGLSLLDQAVAFGNGAVRTAEVREMLGTVDRQRVHALLEALDSGDGTALLREAAALADFAPDYAGVLDEMGRVLHRLAVLQAVPDAAGGEDVTVSESSRSLAERLSPEDVQLYYQIATMGRRDLPAAPDPRTGFEMVLLRMLAFRPAEAGEAEPATATSRTPASEPAAPAPAPQAVPEPNVTRADGEGGPAQQSAGTAAKEGGDWLALVGALPLTGFTRELAQHCAVAAWEADRIELVLDPTYAHLLTEARRDDLTRALQESLGRTLRVQVRSGEVAGETPAQTRSREASERQAAAEQAIAEDPNAQAILERFGGRVQPGSVEPCE